MTALYPAQAQVLTNNFPDPDVLEGFLDGVLP